MKKVPGMLALMLAVTLPAFAQSQGRLLPDDQREFDNYYTKWVSDTARTIEMISAGMYDICRRPWVVGTTSP